MNIIERITSNDLMHCGLTFFIKQCPFLETVPNPFTYDETAPLRSVIYSGLVSGSLNTLTHFDVRSMSFRRRVASRRSTTT